MNTESENITTPTSASMGQLVQQYDLFLFDAYGVLIDGVRAFPEAILALHQLNERGVPFYILTNDASKSVLEATSKYGRLGLPVKQSQIISSGMLVTDYFNTHGLSGAKTLALGPENALDFVRQANAELLPFTIDAEPDVIVILDDKTQIPFHDAMEILISILLRTYSRGHTPHLLLANPDLLYPAGNGRFNLAAGSIADMLERILETQYYDGNAPRFTRVGKPFAPLYEKALSLEPERTPVMIGDQLRTDILGAKTANIASSIVLTGITSLDAIHRAPNRLKPDYVLDSLAF